MNERQCHFKRHESNPPHSVKEYEIVQHQESGGSQLATTSSHPDLSGSPRQGPNNGIKMDDHERSRRGSWTLKLYYTSFGLFDERMSSCHSCSCIMDISNLRHWINANISIQWNSHQTGRDKLNIWYFILYKSQSLQDVQTYIHLNEL
jgi:hypothetical protein